VKTPVFGIFAQNFEEFGVGGEGREVDRLPPRVDDVDCDDVKAIRLAQ